jgi:hypothetical protein
MEDMRKAYKILVRKPEGKKPPRRPHIDGRSILKHLKR